jgi:anti-sigma regulatory factor (Ser/Thr protein kinase)
VETAGPDLSERPSVRLTVAPEPRLLGTVRLVVATAARRAGLDEEQIEDLKVAVSEACALSIHSVRDAGRGDPVEVDLFEDEGRFGIEVRDRAPDNWQSAAGATSGVEDRVFGLALVSALVDSVESRPRSGGGHATRFWLPIAKAGESARGASGLPS